MYYEIMREYADGDQTSKDFEIFIRPSSGYLGVWYFKLQDDGSKLAIDHKHSRRGEDCTISMDIWRDLAKNTDPPWVFPKNNSVKSVNKLFLVPSFVYVKYLPKNEKEFYLMLRNL